MYTRVRYYLLLTLMVVSVNIRLSGQEGSADSSFVQIFYPNGQLSSEGTMKKEKPDGYWRSFYITGVIKSEGKRTNFLLDSIWNFYNQAGELSQDISYKLGENISLLIVLHKHSILSVVEITFFPPFVPVRVEPVP